MVKAFGEKRLAIGENDIFSRQDFVFRGDLRDKPVSVVTVLTDQGYVTFVETLPVLTLRGGAFSRDILGVAETKDEALAVHEKAVSGGTPDA